MAEAPVLARISEESASPGRFDSSMSLRTLVHTLVVRRRVALGILGGLLLVCLAYCLIAPKQYEARARLALRIAPATTLDAQGSEGLYSGSLASGQVQLETLADVFRSDQLAWRAILATRLYEHPAFAPDFAARFPGFKPGVPDPVAQAYLLERMHNCLHVGTVPRTLLVELRFRSRDAALSAEVMRALIGQFEAQESESRVSAADQETEWIQGQMRDLRAQSDRDQKRLAAFQRQHGLLVSPQTLPDGQPGDAQHVSTLLEVDELGRELAAATSERILREAEYRAAAQGDPELVLASDPRLQSESSNPTMAAFRQLRARQSDLEQEQAQLSLERGPNFPRMQEIGAELRDLNSQMGAQRASLRDQFKKAWQTAADREGLIRGNLEALTGEGRGVDEALASYETMRREADGRQELYIHMQQKLEEARLDAPAHSSRLWVVDAPRIPAKPVAPNLPLYMAIAFFCGIWAAIGGALLMEHLRPSAARAGSLLILALACVLGTHAQAPTPSTSGLPTGVAKIPGREDAKAPANPKEAPRVWTGAAGSAQGIAALGLNLTGAMPAPIAPGDLLDVSEFHTPEFHSSVRVSAAGTVALPLVGEVNVNGMGEADAAKAIAAALVARGMLLHPQVFVLVTSAIGQDVSVLGEVGRPGVYPYGAHHRLLDLIAAAAGLTPAAGTVVSIAHRDAPEAPRLIALADGDAAAAPELNPELLPGDTVRVSRTGLVYVVGDVLRPGGFAMEPGQPMTVLRAIALAWGPSMNASLNRALLIREQKGGRTVTTLNLKRMLRGQDPDMPVEEHDILYVPDSTAKNLWNRTMESIVQSTAGVSIYAGMVYSQRF